MSTIVGKGLSLIADRASFARARSTKSLTAEYVAAASELTSPTGGTASGGSTYTLSPAIRRRSRLVANTAMEGQVRPIALVSSAAVSITCSQLSRTMSIARSLSALERLFASFFPLRPNRAETCGTTSSSVVNEPRSANQTPSLYSARKSDATARAARVFPTPPSPTIVTIRFWCSNTCRSATASTRPTNESSESGTLVVAFAALGEPAICGRFRRADASKATRSASVRPRTSANIVTVARCGTALMPRS